MIVLLEEQQCRLANRLYTFAFFLANSIEYKYELVNLAFDDYCSYFEGTKVKNKKITKEFIRENSSEFFNATAMYRNGVDMNSDAFVQRAKTSNVLIGNGWGLKDSRNFEKHASRIRETFTPVPQHQSNVTRLIGSARKTSDTLIGVHIRRADYRTWHGGRYYRDDAFYMNKMREERASLPGKKVAFLICSDEKINLDNFSGLDTYLGTGHFVEDLYSLAGCDRIIGPISTYSMWAAFYGQIPRKSIV